MPLASMSNVTSICGCAARSGPDALEPEAAELAVVGCQLALALEHDDVDRRLVVLRGREHLGAPRRDRRVALDHLRHHAAQRLQPERQRGDVEQHDVLDLALEDAGLQRRADATTSSGLTVMFGSLPPVSRRTSACTVGHAGRAADEDDLVDVVRRQLRVGQRLLDRAAAALEQVGRQLLELARA